MSDNEILDIFYSKVVYEAQTGQVDCYFAVNIAFNLIINNLEISKCKDLPYSGLLIPNLKITDKILFDKLLIQYVKTAINFYNPSNFNFLNDANHLDKETYLIKYIICTLLANASFKDWDNPIDFLQSRIAMFNNKIIDNAGIFYLGYLYSINAKLYVEEEKSPIKAETPFRIISYLEFDDGYKLLLPEIYVGTNGEKYQLYGIQKTIKSNEAEERPYLKQIRKGFIAKINGAPEHYFLAFMICLSLCYDKEIEVIPFLVERWNAKNIALSNKAFRKQSISLSEIEDEQNRIQNNITDIIIRYFTKLADVTSGLYFNSVPFELDSNLHIQVKDNLNSRSLVFNEIFKLINDYKVSANKFKR